MGIFVECFYFILTSAFRYFSISPVNCLTKQRKKKVSTFFSLLNRKKFIKTGKAPLAMQIDYEKWNLRHISLYSCICLENRYESDFHFSEKRNANPFSSFLTKHKKKQHSVQKGNEKKKKLSVRIHAMSS